MSDFIREFLEGKKSVTNIQMTDIKDLFFQNGDVVGGSNPCDKKQLSTQAQAVYDSGLELWKYYHSQRNTNPDASFYDIRKYFQGETKGRMNTTSDDEHYNELIADLRGKQKVLAKKIEQKVYEYGFLK